VLPVGIGGMGEQHAAGPSVGRRGDPLHGLVADVVKVLPAQHGAGIRHLPQLAPWTEQDRFEPITELMAGSLLSHTDRGQCDADRNVAVAASRRAPT
jgi:hypothetical protein